MPSIFNVYFIFTFLQSLLIRISISLSNLNTFKYVLSSIPPSYSTSCSHVSLLLDNTTIISKNKYIKFMFDC